jgi:rhodanese-related sulfurtransferase
MSLFARLFRRPLPSVTSPLWIEASAVARRLGAPDAPLVLDVRGPDGFTGLFGHIQGARNLPLPERTERMHEVTGPGRPIVAVCKTDRRSAVAASQLLEAGAVDVSVLRGGMATWRRLGLPKG